VRPLEQAGMSHEWALLDPYDELRVNPLHGLVVLGLSDGRLLLRCHGMVLHWGFLGSLSTHQLKTFFSQPD
jgi:hypothetical protein